MMHRDAERAEASDQRQHVVAAQWIEAGGRLVEQHEFRIADDRLRKLRALAHAGREAADRAKARFVETNEIEDVRRPLTSRASRQSTQLAERCHHVGGGLVERQTIVLGHVAEARPHRDRVGADIDSTDLDRTLGRSRQPKQQAEHRRLAGAVRADQPDKHRAAS